MVVELEKVLKINEISESGIPGVGVFYKYVLKLGTTLPTNTPDEESILSFRDEEALRVYGLEPATQLAGQLLAVRLQSREVPVQRRDVVETYLNLLREAHLNIDSVWYKGPRYEEKPWETGLETDDLVISAVGRRETQNRIYRREINPPTLQDEATYFASFNNMPRLFGPIYNLHLQLNQQEHDALKELPPHAVMKVTFGLTKTLQ